ncbi:MAG: hypothetical protein Q8865_09430 [Bacillota bacterium]|nr:hypothetical protein [Bacillota bacterium]
MNKKLIWVIVIAAAFILVKFSYRTIDEIQYRNSEREVKLNYFTQIDYDMTNKPDSFWIPVRKEEELLEIDKINSIDLPSVDFNKEILTLSYGKKLEHLKYNLREPEFKTRGKYIGFSYFEQGDLQNKIFIYKIDKIPLMNTDEACYPPDCKGLY